MPKDIDRGGTDQESFRDGAKEVKLPLESEKLVKELACPDPCGENPGVTGES